VVPFYGIGEFDLKCEAILKLTSLIILTPLSSNAKKHLNSFSSLQKEESFL